MLRLSRLADYGVMVMAHVAAAPTAVHTAEAAAAATGLPGPTVAKLLAKLGRAGLLVSQRGAKGGYSLSRPAAQIAVADIIAALDGPIALTQCAHDQPSTCDRENLCVSRGGINKINNAIRQALESVSLAELTRPHYDFMLPPVQRPAASRPS